MPQLPFVRDQRRAARPVSPLGQLAPGRHLGITAGVPEHPLRASGITSLGGTSMRHMASGGMVRRYDDGGEVDDMPTTSGEGTWGGGNKTFVDAADPSLSGASDYTLQGGYVQPYGSLGDLSMPQSQQAGQGPLLGSKDTDTEMGQGGSGLAGWLQNKHAGFTGKSLVNAGITALTGIISGIANKRASKRVPNLIGGNPAPATPAIKAIGVPLSFADGGAVSFPGSELPAPDGGGSSGSSSGSNGLSGLLKMLTGSALSVPGAGHPDGLIPDGLAAGGSVTPQAQQGQAQQRMIVGNAIKALQGTSQNPQADIQAFLQVFGPDALKALAAKVQGQGGQQPQQGIAPPPQSQPGMAGGGYLSGPGDGMSDGIHANGGGVRVADGEYVIPADVVAHIGNGSSNAGARKLDHATSHLRRMKNGITHQPPSIPDSSNPILQNLGS